MVKLVTKKENFIPIEKHKNYTIIRYQINNPEEKIIEYIQETIFGEYDLQKTKDIIENYINSEVQNNIISGLNYNSCNIWLSKENQQNYKAAVDLAIQSEGKNLPYRIRATKEGNPHYINFNTLDELKDFWATCINHIQSCILKGWSLKDVINWSAYE